MKRNYHTTPTMKYLEFLLAISLLAVWGVEPLDACGPYYPDDPNSLLMFRSCSPELERQWQDGCRFQDYEKDENCLLWQRITSPSIPLRDIEAIVYKARHSDLKDLSGCKFADNKFAVWLLMPQHKDDLKYLQIAKEIEETRDYMNDPWYYAYDGDEEHVLLKELLEECKAYRGERHAARYALQMARLYFANKDYQSCLNLWENSVSEMPQNIVTDIIASYVGGAYLRSGNRDKAIELYTRSQDIGSLINLRAWEDVEQKSAYTDNRVKQLEYIFNRFPNSPLLSIRLQEYVRDRESFVYNFEDWKDRGFHDPVYVKTYWVGDSLVADDEHAFYDELKIFAHKAISSPKCHQKGMWLYSLAYLHYLDGSVENASTYLHRAESSDATPLIKESIRAFRFLLDAHSADNSKSYRIKLLHELKWLDERMKEYSNLNPTERWQYTNKMNWPYSYWQDAARKVLLGVVCPKMEQAGNYILALQLANYASNRMFQLCPLYEAYHSGWNDPEDKESYSVIMPFDEFRTRWSGFNYFDYSNQFFEQINGVTADDAAGYAARISEPLTELDRFLNDRGYIDKDYIYDIVGTLYLREMNYEKASYWLAKVTADYQTRTNIAKEGYFKLDPFRYQFDQKHFISDSTDYKLRFAQEMERLGRMIDSDAEPNRKAEAKIRYAIGLRNSFGVCWYLTQYGYDMDYESDPALNSWQWFTSIDRKGFRSNTLAQKAYEKVDALIEEALAGFSDPEKAAKAQLEMMNYATVMKKYPHTKAASYIRSRCDNYYDYTLQKR